MPPLPPRAVRPAAEVAPGQPAQLVEHFFRHEAGRLHGALLRLFGAEHFALVEDVTQEALLRALRSWSMGGVPPNPSAWISRVAINLARDALRHQRMRGSKNDALATHFEQSLGNGTLGQGEHEIRDDALRLLFTCCHPSIAPDAQVILALKILCGFSTAEIARAFLSSEAAIEKQLTRTKQRIQEANIAYEVPTGPHLTARLDGVLAALYLLFNEGYKASTGERLLREELCVEAVRLMLLLVQHPACGQPRCHALLALMLLTAARFPARVDAEGRLLRLEEQDRSRWDPALIERGLVALAQAAEGDEVSEYHLQAGIAAIHCTAADAASTDWPRILRYYDELERLKPSPVVALNRAVAVAHVHGPQAALQSLHAMRERVRLDRHYLLHAVEGELYWRLGQDADAAASFRRAVALAQVGPEQDYLTRMLDRASDGLLAG